MNFDIPEDISNFLNELDAFIEAKIKPLEQADDNIRFFDHRREDARTDWERDGLPNEQWEQLLQQAKQLAIEAGSSAASCATDWPWTVTGWPSTCGAPSPAS